MPFALVRRLAGDRLFYAWTLLFCFAAGASAEIAVYPVPSVYTKSADFTVSVSQLDARATGSASQVGAIDFTSGPNRKVQYDFAQFSFSGKVQVTVTAISQKSIQSFAISPLTLAIPGVVQGNSLTFTLEQSRYLIIKINNLQELILAADPAESSPPASSGTGIENITAAPYGVTPNDGPGSAAKTSAQFAAAIGKASAEGGTVYVPAGVFYINNLVLHSNVTLYLAGGAVLRSSDDTAAMTKDFYKSTQGKGTWLISTLPDSKNIAITGRGMIDGDGYTMRNGANLSGGNLVDTLIIANKTMHFTIDGITAWDAGFWTVMPVRSTGVSITNFKGLEALAPEGCNNSGKLCMYENDAIDIVESSNVLVKHSIAVSQDDNYSTKTWSFTRTQALDIGTNWAGTSQPIDNVLVTDATGWAGFDVFKIGGGIGQPQSNITFDRGYVYLAKRALDVFPKYGSATTSKIMFRNIDIETTLSTWANFANPGGPVKDVTFSRINIRNTGGPRAGKQHVILPEGRPGNPITNVTFTDVVNNGSWITTVQELIGTPKTDSITGLTITPAATSLPKDSPSH